MVVLGFHGTTLSAAQEVYAKRIKLPYESQYRWLGNGIYFFEEHYSYASAWAKIVAARVKQKNPKLEGAAVTPAVVKAVIDLTGCLDLTDPNLLLILRNAYDRISRKAKTTGETLPDQKPFTVTNGEVLAGYWDEYKEFGKNALDYLVINIACGIFEKKENVRFRSVRAVFTEGLEAYNSSWIFDKSHVAIAVRDPYHAIDTSTMEIMSAYR